MHQSYPKSFLKDNGIVILGHIIVYMKGIIMMPIIIKTVGITIYGGFVLLSSVLGIVFGISSFGTGFRAKRFMPSTTDMLARRDLFYPQFTFGLVSILFLSALLLTLNRPINVYIFKNEIEYSVLLIAPYLISYVLFYQGSNYFRYTSRVKYMTAADISFPYIHIGLILLFYYCFRYVSIDALMMSHTIAALLVAIPCFWIIFKEIGCKFSFYNIKGLVSDIKIGYPLVLGFIIDFILTSSDRYFIALYMSVSAVGYYNPGYVLGSIIIFIPKAMGTALPQLISRAVDNKNNYEAQRMVNYALKIFLLTSIPFIFGCLVLGKPIFTILANSLVADNAYLVTPVVALGMLFYGLNIIISGVLFVRLDTHSMFKMNFYASMFNLIANFILLYFIRNIIVAAATTALSYFISFLYLHKIVKKDWPIDFGCLAIAKSVAASLFMVTLLLLVSQRCYDSILVISVTGRLVLGVFSYIAGLLVLRTFTKKELQFVKSCIFP